MASLSLENISKSYGKQVILKGLDLQIESGSSFALIGQNGAGKTTLLRMIAGQLLPDEGNLSFKQVAFGKDGWPEHIRRRIGLSLAVKMLPPELTPFEFLSFIGQIYSLPTASWKERRDSLLDFLLRPEDHHKRLHKLSSGNQIKVSLAAAYLPNPDLILLDEPFNGLDLISTQKVIELIRGRQKQAITLISSHQLAILPELCDQVGILHDQTWVYRGEMQKFQDGGKEQLSEKLLHLLQPHEGNNGKLSWQG